MTPKLDRDTFAVLARRSGVPLDDAAVATLYEGYGLLEGLVADLDRPSDPATEPAPSSCPSLFHDDRSMMPATIAEASRLIAARHLSPVELTRHHLARIERLNPTVAAFITVTPERALADAHAAEARIMADGPRTPLDGIPIAHKDLFDTAGIRTTAHSRVLLDHVPGADATMVTRLAQAGTVMLGKLAMYEFALNGSPDGAPFPPAANPWNTGHSTSGSSSGTASAIAAGLIMGGTGTDTGGSIRSPAALCGTSGIKPTYGRCSRAGSIPLAFTLDHAGPMAWTAEDSAMLLQAMAGHDPRDPASADVTVPNYRAGLEGGVKGLRVGWSGTSSTSTAQ